MYKNKNDKGEYPMMLLKPNIVMCTECGYTLLR